MNRKYVITAVALLAVGSGVGGFVFLNSGTTIQELNRTVISQEDLGEGFEQTQETFTNSSAYNNSAIQLRVDRRFADGNGTVVLSSATVYSSEEAADRTRISFIGRTADNFTTTKLAGKEVTKIYQDTLFKDVIYFYHQKEDKIYFVSVASYSDYREEKARDLMNEMMPKELLSQILS